MEFISKSLPCLAGLIMSSLKASDNTARGTHLAGTGGWGASGNWCPVDRQMMSLESKKRSWQETEILEPSI